MAWKSPRFDREHAKQVGEHDADDTEKNLGRPLTAAELAEVHANARKTVAAWGSRARRQAEGK